LGKGSKHPTHPGTEAMPRYLTTAQVATIFGQRDTYIRRLVDQLKPPVDRFGLKRMIPRRRLAEIEEILRSRGRLEEVSP
jgi:hypothetical protein